MKKLFKSIGISISLILLSAVIMFAQAQGGESAKEKNIKDIATFGTLSTSKDVPEDLLKEVDNQVVTAIEELKRFRVQGLQNYRFASDNVEEFIKAIQGYRLEAGKNKTADQKFAGVSLTGDEFDKLMQAFLVAIPVVSNYSVSYTTSKKEKTNIIVKKCELKCDLTIKFIDVAGAKTIDPIKVSFDGEASKEDTAKGTAEKLVGAATGGETADFTEAEKAELFTQARSDAVGGMAGVITMKIRQHPFFQLKTKILDVNGADITIELGQDLGISPGDEFKVEIEENLGNTEFKKKTEVGYIRIHSVEEGASIGRLLWGSVQNGDPVIENALYGVYIDLKLGMATWNRTKEFKQAFKAGFDKDKVDEDFKDDSIMPSAQLSFGKEIGYQFKIEFDLGTVIPLEGKFYSFLGELGGRWTYYFGGIPLSFDIGLFGTVGGIYGKWTDDSTGTDVDAEVTGVAFGGKGELNLYYQIGANFKLGLGGGFRFTTDMNKDNLTYKVDGNDSKSSIPDNDEIKSNFTGAFANLTIQGRF